MSAQEMETKGDVKNSYVVAGATVSCTQGDQTSRLTMPASHGVFVKEKAQMNVMELFAGESDHMTCDPSSIVMDGITDIQGQLFKMEGWVKGAVQVDEEEEDEDAALHQLGLDVGGMIPVAGGGSLG